eukprot:357162-Chlamydomonas_euryale.AAC.3
MAWVEPLLACCMTCIVLHDLYCKYVRGSGNEKADIGVLGRQTTPPTPRPTQAAPFACFLCAHTNAGTRMCPAHAPCSRPEFERPKRCLTP